MKPAEQSTAVLGYGVTPRIPVGKPAWAAIAIQAIALATECYYVIRAARFPEESVYHDINDGVVALAIVIGTFAAVVAIVPLVVKLRRHGVRSQAARRPTVVLAISILIWLAAAVVAGFAS